MSQPSSTPARGVLGRGIAVSAAARLVQAALSFAMLAVVGRMLGAEAYGIFALALVAVTIGDIVVGGGLTESLVQRAELTRGHEDASFWATLLAGVALHAVAWAAAGPIAALFGQPLLAQMLPVLLLVLPGMAVGAVPYARLQRGLRFGAIGGIEAAAAMVNAAAAIALVFAGWHVWGLVVAELLRTFVRTAALLAASRYRPGFAGRFVHLRELALFNAGSLGVRALSVADRMLPRVLIGALLGAQALGYYAIAWRLYEQAAALLMQPLAILALPVAARAQADPAALRALLAQAVKLSSAIAFPAFIGLAALSPLLLPLVVGPGWEPAIICMQIMLLLGLRSAMTTFNSGVLRGLGRPDMQAATIGAGALLTLVLVPLAAPFGLVAVTLAVVARRFLTWPLSAWQVQRLTGFDWRAQGRAVLPNLVAALVMGCVVAALHWALSQRLSALALLALLPAAGALTYGLALAVLDRAGLRAVVAQLRRVLARRAARAARGGNGGKGDVAGR